jgi:hypothetical protein
MLTLLCTDIVSFYPGENNRIKPEIKLAETGGRRGGTSNEVGNKRFGQPGSSRNGNPRFKKHFEGDCRICGKKGQEFVARKATKPQIV